MSAYLKELERTLRHPIRRLLLRDVYDRIREIEYRSFNRRFYAIEQVAEYLIGAQIPGDYCEFGVFEGNTFLHAYRNMGHHFPAMRFVAFDSFEGLPAPRGLDAEEGYSSHFHERQFACSEGDFIRNLRRNRVDLTRVSAVKGWFHETLAPGSAELHGVSTVAVAWVDCDLYESTVPVLEYLTSRLVTGSVLIFDDWRCFRNLPDFGEQRAAREWLDRNPKIALRELLSFGWNGIAFTVSSS